jgi:uncharacterized membrane protein (UPF0127 family)
MSKDEVGKTFRALNPTRGTILCERLEVAASMAAKSRGLLGRDSLAPGAGMLFENGGVLPLMWMHMFFMRFAVDIVFLNHDNRVLRINHSLHPWRVSSVVFGARRALELEAGAALRSGTAKGDQLELAEVSP